jgi:hydrogenase nickel incorporation protein HypB
MVRTNLKGSTLCGPFAASTRASRAESICTWATAKLWSNTIRRPRTPDWPNDEELHQTNNGVGLALVLHSFSDGGSEARSKERKAMIQQIEAAPDEIYDIELEHSLLEANAKLAQENRALLDHHGITAIDVMGAIGSGKTTLITHLVERLKDQIGVAVFNGDATTSNDADLIASQSVPVVQIATVNGCHLDANLVGKALTKTRLDNLRLIFIENIGNLICPAEFPLGSKARVVVVSVTEGPYMVRKHPHMFLGAQLVVINKIDLAEAMGVSVSELTKDVHQLKPDITVIPTSCKTGAGLDQVKAALLAV